MRIGLARGEVVAGVLGRERLLYDLWGDAVNVASRLETSARGGEILVTDGVAALLEATHELGLPSLRELKGKGEIGVRSLKGRLDQLETSSDDAFQNSSSRSA
jgi:class 3 adenylate cyclase